MLTATCPVCGTNNLELGEDGTLEFHSSERYRTCPGSRKKAN